MLFFQWLVQFDMYIGKTPGRQVVLLLDICSAHGTIEILPSLGNVHILFLPKNTTARLQPLDAGVIATIKKRYRRRVMKRAVDLIELGITENLYNTDIRLASQNIYEIFNALDNSIIKKCWIKTGIDNEGVSQ